MKQTKHSNFALSFTNKLSVKNMNNLTLKIGITIFLFLLIIVSGVWIAKTGRPLNSKIFAVHKIISVLTIVLGSIFISQMSKTFGINQQAIIFIVLTVVFVILEIATGAILSFEKPINSIILYLHKIIPVLILIFSGLTVYLLAFKK